MDNEYDEDLDFDDEESFDETFDTESEELTEEPTAEVLEEEEEKAPPPIEEEAPVAAAEPREALVSPQEVPMHLTVEVGHLRMRADELLALQPGNLVDLKLPVDSNVNLVLNGKRVGRGELVRMGEVLGVRVTELG